MGNILGVEKRRPFTIHDLSVKIGDYRTINEGDPEMKEDPEFPRHMMREALDKNNTIEGSVVQGTYVYYPNKRKPKMWIGNYRILNPEDILCEKIANSIGMTEAEWKQYVETKKQEDQKLEGVKTHEYPTFDMTEMDKNQMEELLGKQNIDYSYDHSELYGEAKYDQHYFPRDTLVDPVIESSTCVLPKARDPTGYTSRHPTSVKKQDNGEMYNNEEYVQRLNREADRIRQEQESEIEQQRKDIFAYSNSKQYENDLLQYIESGEGVESARKSKKDQSSSSIVSTKKSKDQSSSSIVSTKKSKDQSSTSIGSTSGLVGVAKIRKNQKSSMIDEFYDLKKKGMPTKGHATLASMSTKASFVITESDSSKKRIIRNQPVRNAVVH